MPKAIADRTGARAEALYWTRGGSAVRVLATGTIMVDVMAVRMPSVAAPCGPDIAASTWH